ncbi:MAG: hypothetical protein ACOCX4_07230, partial [Planctomycetota bacterium]
DPDGDTSDPDGKDDKGDYTDCSTPTTYMKDVDDDGTDETCYSYWENAAGLDLDDADTKIRNNNGTLQQPGTDLTVQETQFESLGAFWDSWDKPIVYFYFKDASDGSLKFNSGDTDPYPGPQSGFEEAYELWSCGPDGEFEDFQVADSDDKDADNLPGHRAPAR